MTRQDRIIALIRTYVPALVGAVLAFIVAHVPVVASYIDAIDSTLASLGYAGASVTVLLQAVLVSAVIGLYYWLAQLLASKWPAAQKWLLGHSATPMYKIPTVTIPVHAEVTPTGLQIKTEGGSVLGTVNLPPKPTDPPKYGS